MEDWRVLLAPEVRAFIQAHEGADVAALALKKPPNPDWNYKLVLDQIKARAKAKFKVSDWFDIPDIVFPSADLMEQASSWPCALYKASLVKGERVADLTAGAGVDSVTLGRVVMTLICVEMTPYSACVLAHNLSVLKGAGRFGADFSVHIADSQDFVSNMPFCDWVYVDPQRRGGGKKGRYLFSECSPDVHALLPSLRGKAAKLMIKTSPVLDITKGIEELGGVEAVHVVQWDGECKEVLYIVDLEGGQREPQIHAVDIDEDGQVLKAFSFTLEEERAALADIGEPEAYLYEPGPAFLKAGGFNLMAVRFGLRKLHKNTHLYTSSDLIAGFPGKVYKIEDVRSPGDDVADIDGAELVLRNYPGSVDDLRRKLKLREGSGRRIFACAVADSRKKLVICSKISCYSQKKKRD